MSQGGEVIAFNATFISCYLWPFASYSDITIKTEGKVGLEKPRKYSQAFQASIPWKTWHNIVDLYIKCNRNRARYISLSTCVHVCIYISIYIYILTEIYLSYFVISLSLSFSLSLSLSLTIYIYPCVCVLLSQCLTKSPSYLYICNRNMSKVAHSNNIFIRTIYFNILT